MLGSSADQLALADRGQPDTTGPRLNQRVPIAFDNQRSYATLLRQSLECRCRQDKARY